MCMSAYTFYLSSGWVYSKCTHYTTERETECVSEGVCVCVIERENKQKERESVCVSERKGVCVCERECVFECV